MYCGDLVFCMIETDTATFRKSIGTSFGAARLAHLARPYTLTKVLPLKRAVHVTLTLAQRLNSKTVSSNNT